MKQQNGNNNGNGEIEYPQDLMDSIIKITSNIKIYDIEEEKNIIAINEVVAKIDSLQKKIIEQDAKINELNTKISNLTIKELIGFKQKIYLWWNLIIQSKLLTLIIVTIIIDIAGLILFSNTVLGFAMVFGSTLLLYEIFYVTFKKSRTIKIIKHND